LIQAQRDLVELRLRDGGQVSSSGEVLPQQQQIGKLLIEWENVTASALFTVK